MGIESTYFLPPPLGLVQWKWASSRVEAGTSGFCSWLPGGRIWLRSQGPCWVCSGVSGLVFCGGMELRFHLKLFKDNTTFRDVCGTCGFFGDARGRQCSFLLCLHPQGCLRRGVRASCSPQVRTGKLGSFSMLHHPLGYVSNFLVRPASSWGAQESPGTLSKQSRGIDPTFGIRRRERAQMK